MTTIELSHISSNTIIGAENSLNGQLALAGVTYAVSMETLCAWHSSSKVVLMYRLLDQVRQNSRSTIWSDAGLWSKCYKRRYDYVKVMTLSDCLMVLNRHCQILASYETL